MTASGEDIVAIRQLAEDWRCGWLSGDTELLLSLFADEPVILPQDHPPIAGKAAIRSLYDSIFTELAFESNTTLVEVESSGDLGYIWAAYVLAATPKAGGSSIKSEGKSIFIVKRQSGGDWRIARLIDNSDSNPEAVAA